MPPTGSILILTASTGAGHVVAARGLLEAFERRVPGAARVVDILDHGNPLFRKLYAGGYLWIIQNIPSLMGWLYDANDVAEPRWRRAARRAFQRASLRGLGRFLLTEQPRLIVNTHFLAAEIVAEFLARGSLDCRQVTVVTDIETHRLWAQTPTARYYAASELGAAGLRAWGVVADDIRVTGIPVRSAFERPFETSEVRRSLDLEPQRPVVLLLSGGLGVGPTGDWLQALLDIPPEAQIVVSTGRNERLRNHVERIRLRAGRDIRVVGYTPEVHAWVQAADIVISKPGGLTTSESLVCGRAMVIISPIPGQETRNADYLLEHGAAIKVNHPLLLAPRVTELLTDPDRLRQLQRSATGLARPGAADAVADDALTLLTAPLR